ncbi:DUF362 domain-containing protein [Candidatus Latescibacterota bacterium]
MISRRNFIQSSALITAISGRYFTGKVYAQGKADLSVITGPDIESNVRAAVGAIGGMEAFVKNGDRVAIKPNLSFASPVSRATTTNPEVLRAVIKLCHEVGARSVSVIDHPLQDAAIIGTEAEVAQVVKEIKNTSIFLPVTENLYVETAIPKGIAMKSTKVVKILAEMDVLINVPISKNHSATAVSLGIKGNLGLVWDRIAYHNSSDFNQSLADLGTIIKPDLTIVDAIRALATRGPQGPGRVLNLDTIIAGTDPVAVDSQAVALTFAQWNLTGSNVDHLKKSAAMGLGELDPAKLNITKQTL